MREKQLLDEKVTRRTLLQLTILSTTGLLGLRRLTQAMTSSSEVFPTGECRVVTCYNEQHGGHRCDLGTDPTGYSCIKEFYCQHFECNLAGKEAEDFNCESVFGCPKDTGNNKFQCTGIDLLTADFNCYAKGKDGNFTCNPGVRFSCRDFYCNPEKDKFNCGSYLCSASVGTTAAYAGPIEPESF